MAIQETIIPNVQAFYRVYENDPTPVKETYIFHLPFYPDPSSGNDIILWDEILNVFKNILFVRSGTAILPFLKGADSEKYSINYSAELFTNSSSVCSQQCNNSIILFLALFSSLFF
jgi:hypothetical protein